MAEKPRVKVPKKAKSGEIIQIKTLMSHKMETGNRKDKKTGELIPRKIINKFVCTFDGTEVLSADIHPAVAANPLFGVLCEGHQKWNVQLRMDRRRRRKNNGNWRHHRRLGLNRQGR